MVAELPELPDLPLNQQKAAHMLAAGQATAQVAKALGTTYTTVYRWQQRKEFIEYRGLINYKRDETFQEVLEGGAQRAVQFLVSVLEDKDASTTVKLKAADSLVNAYIRATPLREGGQKTTETQELMSFLEALPD